MYTQKVSLCDQALTTAEKHLEKSQSKTPGQAGSSRNELESRLAALNELMSDSRRLENSSLLNAAAESADHLQGSTGPEGRLVVAAEIQRLQSRHEALYDTAQALDRELRTALAHWSGVDQAGSTLAHWLDQVCQLLRKKNSKLFYSFTLLS